MNGLTVTALLFLTLVAAACAAPAAPPPTTAATAIPVAAVQPTQTPVPTETAAPTATATAAATETAVPTKTSIPTATPTVTQTPPPTATSTPAAATSVVFIDDFEAKCQLQTLDDDSHTTGCDKGEYSMVNKRGGYVWRQSYSAYYDDGVISVEGRAPSGDAGIGYGLAFRLSPDSEYYLFTVSPEGRYSLDFFRLRRNGPR